MVDDFLRKWMLFANFRLFINTNSSMTMTDKILLILVVAYILANFNAISSSIQAILEGIIKLLVVCIAYTIKPFRTAFLRAKNKRANRHER